MKILFCSSEVAPFAKTGGLADVAGSLPLALGKLGVKVMVTMPKYRGITDNEKKISPNVTVHFIEQENYYNRASLYGGPKGDFPDNLDRFSFFCEQSLRLAKGSGFKPNVVHAHDWQGALLPVYLKTKFSKDPFFQKTRSLLTIHNLAYQGIFSRKEYEAAGLPDSLFTIEGFEFYGRANLLKAGIIFADAVSTVSPTYAKEIETKEFGFGLEGVLKSREENLRGILNGLDYDEWDPSTDERIRTKYSTGRMRGKAECKRELQRAAGLEIDSEIPVFGMVTRLTEQKGLDILSEISDAFLSLGAQFVLLGDGERVYQTTFKNIEARNKTRAKMYFGFDATSAHAIYAGADFFLMPSYFEPCGLSQMISMRYGTLPIVRHTGGLADTVRDCDLEPVRGNGIVFQGPSPEKLLDATRRAVRLFADKKRFARHRRVAMLEDYSWKKSAQAYKDFYKSWS